MKQRFLLVSILSMYKRNKDYLCGGKPQLPSVTHSWMLMVSTEKYSDPGMVVYTSSFSLRRLRQGCSMFEGSRAYTVRLHSSNKNSLLLEPSWFELRPGTPSVVHLLLWNRSWQRKNKTNAHLDPLKADPRDKGNVN